MASVPYVLSETCAAQCVARLGVVLISCCCFYVFEMKIMAVLTDTILIYLNWNEKPTV